MQTINLPIELVNQILAYLGSRPYQESYKLIDMVQDEAKKQMKAQVNDNVEANDTTS